MAVLTGTSGADVLRGSTAGDQINGLAGDDVIFGFAGADTIDGGPGSDRFLWAAGEGADRVEGGLDIDTQFLTGSATGETFALSANGDHVTVAAGSETLDLHGIETINLKPGGGLDTVLIGDLRATDVHSLVVDMSGSGGAANATQIAIAGATIQDTVLIQVGSTGTSLRVFDTAGGITQTINLAALDGQDRVAIDGGGGDDVLTITTPAAVVSVAPIVLRGGDGSDTLTGSIGADSLAGDAQDDRLDGIAGGDSLDGGAGNDTLNGGAGADLLIGGAGADRIVADFSSAGAGPDTVTGGADSDTVALTATAGADAIVLSAIGGHETVALNGAAILDLTGVETLSVRSGAGADVIQMDLLNGSEVRNSTIDLSGATAGVGDGAADSVKVMGSSASDFLVVLGAGAGSSVRVVEPSVTNSAVEVIGRDADDRVIVDAGGGDDSFVVDLATPLGPLTVDGGAGVDLVTAFVANKSDTLSFTRNAAGAHVTHGAASLDLAHVETVELQMLGDVDRPNTVVVNGTDGAGFYSVSTSVSKQEVFQSDDGLGAGPLIRVLNGAAIQINAGGGDDILTWSGGDFGFDAGAGSDLVSINVGDVGTLSVSDGVVHARRIGSDLACANVERVEMFGSLNGAHYVLFDLSGGSVTQVDLFLGGANPGIDSVVVEGSTLADFVTLSATASAINISGLAASETLHNWASDDTLSFGLAGGDDHFQAGNVSLALDVFAGDGNDDVVGGFGADHLDGSTGNDTLAGGASADTLAGGDGADVMIGGAGDDVFDYVHGGFDGQDTILDFQVHNVFVPHDRIAIDDQFIHHLSDLIAAHRILQVGADVIIKFDFFFQTDITLKGISLQSLNDLDFIFS